MLTIRSQFDQILESSCRNRRTARADIRSSCRSLGVMFAEPRSKPRAGW